MKLSVITDEIADDLPTALQVAREFDLDAVELRTLWGVNIALADEEILRRAKALLREYGLGVCSLATPVFKTDLFGATERGLMHAAQEADLAAQLPLLQHCLEVAAFFDAPLVRIFAFWRAGALTPEREAQIQNWLERALPYAERADILLGLENEHSCQVGTGAELAQLLSRVRSPYLVGVWDPGNAFVLGESAQAGFAAAQPYVRHIHIKDGVRQPNGTVQWVVVGQGEVGYAEHFAQIARSGYRGYLSLETHARVEGLTQAAVSRQCLQAMHQLIQASSGGN
ncbi:MAG: sugar phosphate isomerase/epimerase [Fimbriimonadales bacterium]|nr:sugar phosphate isomerase/epimerase [Fimbriimonadales bacterium]